MNKGQKKIMIGAAAIVGAIIFLIYSGIKETSVYFLTVTEASEMAESGQDLRIGGKVLIGSIKKDSDELGAQFILTDDEKQIPIKYKGTIPDMFQADAEVVVQGRFGPSGKFEAYTLMTSCPSRYESVPEEVTT